MADHLEEALQAGLGIRKVKRLAQAGIQSVQPAKFILVLFYFHGLAL